MFKKQFLIFTKHFIVFFIVGALTLATTKAVREVWQEKWDEIDPNYHSKGAYFATKLLFSLRKVLYAYAELEREGFVLSTLERTHEMAYENIIEDIPDDDGERYVHELILRATPYYYNTKPEDVKYVAKIANDIMSKMQDSEISKKHFKSYIFVIDLQILMNFIRKNKESNSGVLDDLNVKAFFMGNKIFQDMDIDKFFRSNVDGIRISPAYLARLLYMDTFIYFYRGHTSCSEFVIQEQKLREYIFKLYREYSKYPLSVEVTNEINQMRKNMEEDQILLKKTLKEKCNIILEE